MFSPEVVCDDKFIDMPTSTQALLPARNDPFDTGVIVIRHWKVNNLIRKDWYRPTTHSEERALVASDKSGGYMLVNETAPSWSTQVVSKVGNNRVLSKDEMQQRLEAGKAVLRGKHTA